MKFQNLTNYSKITPAILRAHRLLSPNSEMLESLRAKNDWQYGAGTGEKVYQQIVNCDKVVKVFTYRPWNPFSRAIAYFDGEAVHINVYKVRGLSSDDLVGMLCHEWLHAAGFNHGFGWFANRKTRRKVKHSVPYFVSENIGRWL